LGKGYTNGGGSLSRCGLYPFLCEGSQVLEVMQVEAGTLHLEYNGIQVEAAIVWDLEPGGPIYLLKDNKIFASFTIDEFKAIAVILRDMELRDTTNDC